MPTPAMPIATNTRGRALSRPSSTAATATIGGVTAWNTDVTDASWIDTAQK